LRRAMFVQLGPQGAVEFWARDPVHLLFALLIVICIAQCRVYCGRGHGVAESLAHKPPDCGSWDEDQLAAHQKRIN